MHIKGILPNVLKSYGVSSDDTLGLIWEKWENIVGSYIAENASPAGINKGVLIVHVPSSTWLQHLQFLKSDLIRKLNATLKKSVVHEIKFKISSA
jgi:predicted nucleic acid-binding Zn ribbon protein